MSQLVVPVAEITNIREHPNADNLEIAEVLGWQVVVGKDQYREGERGVFFPPDTILTEDWADVFGVTQYLSKGRIKHTRLRGEPSFGLFAKPDKCWPLGENVADYYGATKWEPLLRLNAGDALPDHPLFVKYTDIENLRNYPDMFFPGEFVVISEKLHGTNVRVGMIDGEPMAGSHRLRRKEPEDIGESPYWFPWLVGGVRELLTYLSESSQQAIIFGEVVGAGIQSLQYGYDKSIGFHAFDIYKDGHYLSASDFDCLTSEFAVPTAPILYSHHYDAQEARELSSGKSTLADHMREGVVIKPEDERNDPRVGRVIAKYLSDDYLLSKKSDFKEL